MLKKKLPLIFVLLILFTQISFAKTADELIKLAKDAFDSQQYTTALIHLKNAAKDNPRNLSVRLELAKLFVFTGQGIQAQTELDKAKRLGATPEQIQILEIKSQLLVGNFDDVINDFNFLDLPQSEIARVRALQGNAFYEKLQYQQARLMYQRAHLLAPDSMEVQIGQARIHKIDGNKQKETEVIESLLKKYPNDPEVVLVAGEYFLARKLSTLALDLYKKVGETQLSNVNVWFGVVRSYIALERYDEAKKEIQTVLRNFPEHQVGNFLLAVIAYEQNDLARSKAAIEIVLKGQKRNFEALQLLASIQFKLKEYTLAERNIKKFLKANPRNLQGHKTLASIYLKRNQGVKAIRTLLPLKNLNDPFIFSMLANAYTMVDQPEQAQTYLNKAVNLAPKSKVIERQFQRTNIQKGKPVDIKFNDTDFENFVKKGHLAILNLIRQEQFDEAEKIIKGYQNKRPNEGIFDYLLASIALQKLDLESAKQGFIDALTHSPNLVEARINLGKMYLAENDSRAAEKEFLTVLKTDANNDQALMALAGIYSREGNEKEMLKWLNRSRNSNNSSLASREVLISYYIKQRNISKMVELAQEMSDVQPENITLLSKLAEFQKLSGRPDLAAKTFLKIIEIEPNNPEAWYGLGKMQRIDSDNDKSYSSFEKMLELAPNSLVALSTLATYDLQKNDIEKAHSRALSLVEKHPNLAESHEVLGDVFIAQDKPDLAIKEYQKATSIKYTTTAYLKLFSAYNRNQQEDEAFELIKKWVQKFPEDNELKEVLAITYRQRGQFENSNRLYEEIIKTVKDNDRIFNSLALVSLELNSPMSMEYADIAYNLNPKNPLNLDTLGWVQLNNNNVLQALDHLEKAVKTDPSNPDIRYHYAVALSRMNREREAKDQLSLIIKIDGNFINRDKANELYNKL